MGHHLNPEFLFRLNKTHARLHGHALFYSLLSLSTIAAMIAVTVEVTRDAASLKNPRSYVAGILDVPVFDAVFVFPVVLVVVLFSDVPLLLSDFSLS